MSIILKQFKQILFTAALLLCVLCTFAQKKKATVQIKRSKIAVKPAFRQSALLTEFLARANEANVKFAFPQGFKEVKPVDNEYFSFDYGVALPGQDFEIWLLAKSLKQNWASYERLKDLPGKQLANPDSAYLDIGKAHAIALSGSRNYFMRNVPREILADYNADAGKTYLLNLLNSANTKGYRYALLITLQKDHTGMILAVALSNDKGPGFFKNINKARNNIQFK
jgi:hypothetical protein